MEGKESEVLIDIRERTVRIKTIPQNQNYEGLKQTASKAKEMSGSSVSHLSNENQIRIQKVIGMNEPEEE